MGRIIRRGVDDVPGKDHRAFASTETFTLQERQGSHNCLEIPLCFSDNFNREDEDQINGGTGNGKSQLNKRLFHLLSVVILLVGLSSAVLIYQKADRDARAALGYEATDGSVYPIMPEDSKMYLRDMEQFGGKANVLADEFRRWFVGLWQGKSLAFTVACISVILFVAVLYAANHLPSNAKSDRDEE